MTIPKPSPKRVDRYLSKWERLENYVLQESSLRKLFTRTYPRNDEIDDVLIKVCALNDFYSTNIYKPYPVARHIVELNIDPRLEERDYTLVNAIAKVDLGGVKPRNLYSFATKYCSHHAPEDFPIFDSFVEKLLKHLKKQDGFSSFTNADLKDYPSYREILLQFRKFYGLQAYTLKEIDKYLWQQGKEVFQKKTKKKVAHGS